MEVPGSSSGPFELAWTVAPDECPQLSVTRNATNGVLISWLVSSRNWTVVAAARLPSTECTVVTNIPTTVEEHSIVAISPTATTRFFRLKANP